MDCGYWGAISGKRYSRVLISDNSRNLNFGSLVAGSKSIKPALPTDRQVHIVGVKCCRYLIGMSYKHSPESSQENHSFIIGSAISSTIAQRYMLREFSTSIQGRAAGKTGRVRVQISLVDHSFIIPLSPYGWARLHNL